jgi:hypothetical protein
MRPSKPKLLATVIAAALVVAIVAVVVVRNRSRAASVADARPSEDAPRGAVWNVWQAALKGDRDAIRPLLHTATAQEEAAADAMADLYVAEAAFAKQLRRTWPVSPVSRAGGGTTFGETAEADLFSARQQIDATTGRATIIVRDRELHLVRAGDKWKLLTRDLIAPRVQRAGGDTELATQQLRAAAEAYRKVTRETAARRLPSPDEAVKALLRELAKTATTSRPSV